MHLGHRQLQSVIEIDDNVSLASLSAAEDKSMMLEENINIHIPLKEMWCEYPPKRFGPSGIRLLYSISLIEKLLKGLPLEACNIPSSQR
jgi:hypothetical protein